jgi:hypothetical protein
MKRSTGVLAVGALAAGLLAACSGSVGGRAETSRASVPALSAAAEAAGQPAPAPALPSRTALPSQRMVIKTADLSVRVRDINSAFGRAVSLAEAGGGYVQSSSQESSDGEQANLTIRVTPDRFLPLLASLEGLGAVRMKSISGQDVTEEYYDLDAQLGNLNAVRARLLDLLKRATKVADAIEVERELERVGGELNRIEGRMRYLSTMVGLSTINLTLSTEARPAAVPFINWAFVGNGFVVAARYLVQALFFILQALVVVVPIAAIAGAMAYGIWRLVRLLRGRPVRKSGSGSRPRRG